jgi:hypothetical protein
MRGDLVDDEVILTCAKRLMLDGVHPTSLAVAKALNWRWTESPIALALARLRHCGRLVIELPKPAQVGRSAEPKYNPEQVAELAREVRHEGLRQPGPERPETIREWLDRHYWTAVRRDWYRRGSPCA